MRKLPILLLTATLALSLALPAYAAESSNEELKAASQYLSSHGIMVGDGEGNMNFSAPLTRAHLATILARLHGGSGQVEESRDFYAAQCQFQDVPDWARQYAGYCAYHGLMVGYGDGLFGAEDPVTPVAACTVVLRYLDLPDLVWDYNTACQAALDQGLTTGEAIGKTEITRGDLAVMLYRAIAMTGAAPTDSGTGSDASRAGDGYLTNGMPATEENVLALLRQLEQDWPTGTIWGTHDTPDTHKNEVLSTAAREVMDEYLVSEYYGCSGYAAMISSLIFGDASNPAWRLEDLSKIRPGDIVFRVDNETGAVWHIVVALETPNEVHAFHVTDGNNGEVIRWPDRQNPYGRTNLDSYGENRAYHLEAWTRYPEEVSFTGASKNAWPTGPD